MASRTANQSFSAHLAIFFGFSLQLDANNINICYFSRICALLILLLFKIFVRFTLRRVHELTGINLLNVSDSPLNYHLIMIDFFVAGEPHRSFLLVVLQQRPYVVQIWLTYWFYLLISAISQKFYAHNDRMADMDQ